MNDFNPKNECKLMILYMLSRVDFMLTHTQISNFFLDKYTSFIFFQEILAELIDTQLITENKTKTTIHYQATQDGLDTLKLCLNEIAPEHVQELNTYMQENKFKLKEEAMIVSDYYDSLNGQFKIKLSLNETPEQEFTITMDVPNMDTAILMCDKWKLKAKEIYTAIMQKLI